MDGLLSGVPGVLFQTEDDGKSSTIMAGTSGGCLEDGKFRCRILTEMIL